MANKTINPFHAFKGRNINQKIALTGVFMGLVILFQYLEQFMPFGETYMNLNFSLLFILPIFYFAGPFFGIGALLVRFALGPAVSTLGYSAQGLVGQFVLFCSTSVAIIFMYIYSFAFSKVKSHNVKIVLISVTTTISAAVMLTIINGLFFTPLYWWVMEFAPHPYLTHEIIDSYQYIKYMFFDAPNYWAGVFAVYMSANIVKFGLIYIVNYPLSKVLRHYLNR